LHVSNAAFFEREHLALLLGTCATLRFARLKPQKPIAFEKAAFKL
jgi:hypothetical protein